MTNIENSNELLADFTCPSGNLFSKEGDKIYYTAKEENIRDSKNLIEIREKVEKNFSSDLVSYKNQSKLNK